MPLATASWHYFDWPRDGRTGWATHVHCLHGVFYRYGLPDMVGRGGTSDYGVFCGAVFLSSVFFR